MNANTDEYEVPFLEESVRMGKREQTLVISFNTNPKYHWWKDGQRALDTLHELGAWPETIAKYTPPIGNMMKQSG